MIRQAMVLVLAGAVLADDSLVERWDRPRRETFGLEAATAAAVGEEISKRFGVAFRVEGAGEEAKAFAAKDATFFEALDRLAGEYGLGLSGAPVAPGAADFEVAPLRLVGLGGTRTVAPAYVGAGRLSVEALAIEVDVRLAGKDEGVPLRNFDDALAPGLRMRFRWLVEPGCADATLSAFQVEAAEDDLGKRLNVERQFWGTVAANRDFRIGFDSPSKGATAIRKLEGKVRVLLPLERRKVQFLAEEVGQAKALGAARVTVTGIDRKTRTLTVTIEEPPCPGIEPAAHAVRVGSAQGRGNANAIVVLPYDAKGREIGQGGHCLSGLERRRLQVRVELEALPARIEVEALVRATEREAQFSFKDIPLPE